MFGVIGSDGGFVDTSKTLRGAKISASKNGYRAVYKRSETSWQVWPVEYKICGEWLAPEYLKNQRFYRIQCPFDARYLASLEFRGFDKEGDEIYSYLIYFCDVMLDDLEANTGLEAIQLMQEHNAERMAAYN